MIEISDGTDIYYWIYWPLVYWIVLACLWLNTWPCIRYNLIIKQ